MDRITISGGSSEAEVSREGAFVSRLILDGEEVAKPSPDRWQTHGGIAVLIPYAGRVRDGRYSFEGERYRLPLGRDGHAIHGFGKDAEWRVVRQAADSVTLQAKLTDSNYPGVLDCRITYSVGPHHFATAGSAKNDGPRSCPFTAGFHPYFLAHRWKISAAGRVQRYTLAHKYFPTGEKTPFSFAGIGPNADLDDCFRVAGQVRLDADGHTLVMTRRRMPYLIVYNGKYAEGRSVAIEPYTAPDDAFNNGIGLTVLRSGGTSSFGYGVKLLR